jgi:cytochrome c peroxidase
VLARLNASPAYRKLFGDCFPSVAAGGPIDFSMFGRAIAEFEFTLIFANAPIDRFARGDRQAVSVPEKKRIGILRRRGMRGLSRRRREIERDVQRLQNARGGRAAERNRIRCREGNVIFAGPGQDEDFGLEQITGNPADRYKFRSSPLRNLSVQPTFFHNGLFTR